MKTRSHIASWLLVFWFAESGAVPLTIQHILVDRALEDSILENNNL